MRSLILYFLAMAGWLTAYIEESRCNSVRLKLYEQTELHKRFTYPPDISFFNRITSIQKVDKNHVRLRLIDYPYTLIVVGTVEQFVKQSEQTK